MGSLFFMEIEMTKETQYYYDVDILKDMIEKCLSTLEKGIDTLTEQLEKEIRENQEIYDLYDEKFIPIFMQEIYKDLTELLDSKSTTVERTTTEGMWWWKKEVPYSYKTYEPLEIEDVKDVYRRCLGKCETKLSDKNIMPILEVGETWNCVYTLRGTETSLPSLFKKYKTHENFEGIFTESIIERTLHPFFIDYTMNLENADYNSYAEIYDWLEKGTFSSSWRQIFVSLAGMNDLTITNEQIEYLSSHRKKLSSLLCSINGNEKNIRVTSEINYILTKWLERTDDT